MPKPPGDDRPPRDASTLIADLQVVASSKRPHKPHLLQQIAGPGAPSEHLLDLEEIVIGRSAQAQISIESGLLSRRHVLLRRSGPEYTCQDLDSSNGLYLNGIRAHSAVLRDGDLLQIGDVIFIFREGA